MVEISVSVLNVKNENAIKTFYNIEEAETNYFHIDLMDGRFVKQENLKQMKEYATTIKHISNLPLDVHFMVENIKDIIDDYIELQPNIMTFHIEASKENTTNIISYVKEQGIKVGLAISPKTQIKEIEEYLPYIHLVLVMTVEPGLGGQKLLPETIKKIEEINYYREKNNIDFEIEVDGGINAETASLVKNAGADILVAGSAILQSKDYKQMIADLKK